MATKKEAAAAARGPRANGEEEQQTKRQRWTTAKETDIEAILDLLPTIWFKDEEFYVYDSGTGCYQKRTENYIGSLITKELDSSVPVPMIKNYIQKIKWERDATEAKVKFYACKRLDDKGNNVICFRNKVVVVDMRTGEFRSEAHDPK